MEPYLNVEKIKSEISDDKNKNWNKNFRNKNCFVNLAIKFTTSSNALFYRLSLIHFAGN